MYSGGGYAAVRGVGHMEWNMGFQTFVNGSNGLHSGVEHIWGLGTPEGCDGKK